MVSFFKNRKDKNSDIRKEISTNKNPAYAGYDIGDYTYGNPAIHNFSDYDDIATKPTRLKIGKFCSISTNVNILLGSEHRTDWVSTYPFNALFPEFRHIKGHPSTKGDIVIGNDVWIGTNVTILSGVTIGDGAVIGANSLVSKDVNAYSIAAGIPATHIKWRFEENLVKELENLKWWNWPIEKILKFVPLLQSGDIDLFLKEANVSNHTIGYSDNSSV